MWRSKKSAAVSPQVARVKGRRLSPSPPRSRSRSSSTKLSGSRRTLSFSLSPLRIHVLPWRRKRSDNLPSPADRRPLGRIERYSTPTPPAREPSQSFVKVLEDVDPERKLEDFYDVSDKVLGTGHFGSVMLGTHRDTGLTVAIKTVRKVAARNVAMIRNEVEVVRLLRHPEIVEVLDIFEGPFAVNIVMEYCPGGELFDRVTARRRYSESEAAKVMHRIFRAVHYCHEQGVVHRDLKPENFLLETRASDVDVKLIDFGLACRFKPGEKLSARVGTPYYIAPEVLLKEYDYRADLWSCGVIMYILLAGYPPFFGDTDAEIFRRIRRGSFSFPAAEWADVSPAAKELISGLLTMNVSLRLSSAEALSHPWVVCEGKGQMYPFGPWLVAAMRRFTTYRRLKQIALHVISRLLDPRSPQCRLIKQSFDHLDANGDGEISRAELMLGMESLGFPVDDEGADGVMDSADLNGDGVISYEEFAAVIMQRALYLNADILNAAFNFMDIGKDGLIGVDDLTVVLGSKEAAMSVIGESDVDGDGCVEFQEFLLAMCGDEGGEEEEL